MQTRKSARLRAQVAKDQTEDAPKDTDAPVGNDTVDANQSALGKKEEDEEFSLEDLTSLAKCVFIDAMKKNVLKRDVAEAKPVEQEDPSTVAPEGFISLSTEQGEGSAPKAKKKSLTELPPGLQPNLRAPGPLVFAGVDREAKAPSSGCSWSKEAEQDLMRKSVVTADFEQKPGAPVYVSEAKKAKRRKLENEKTAGSGWFHLPATTLTPEIRNDLKILKMRGALNPRQHYKKNDSKEIPKYFQMGRVVEAPAEFYSSRVPRRQRKNTIVEELLADVEFRKRQKKKYAEIVAKKVSGKRIKKLKKPSQIQGMRRPLPKNL